MSKGLVLMLLALLVLSSLVMVGSVSAQFNPKPSVPEFSLKFIPSSYNVTTTDSYTGENVTEQIDNSTIEVMIRNSVYASFSNINHLFFNVRVKGHFSEDWDYLYYYREYANTSGYNPNWLALDKNSEYTTTSYPANYTPGAKLDFQVEAVTIINGQVKQYSHWYDPTGYFVPAMVLGETSNWSKTQTLTIPLRVKLLLPQNGNFSSSDVPLTFVVDGYASKIEYCLDGGDIVSITGNTTLTGLPNGYHNVTVYATDEAGNTGASETLFFTIEEPFPTSLVIASVIPVTVVLVGLGLLVYGIKRKR